LGTHDLQIAFGYPFDIFKLFISTLALETKDLGTRDLHTDDLWYPVRNKILWVHLLYKWTIIGTLTLEIKDFGYT
jgi:hypothetical protein